MPLETTEDTTDYTIDDADNDANNAAEHLESRAAKISKHWGAAARFAEHWRARAGRTSANPTPPTLTLTQP